MILGEKSITRYCPWLKAREAQVRQGGRGPRKIRIIRPAIASLRNVIEFLVDSNLSRGDTLDFFLTCSLLPEVFYRF